MNNEDEQKLQNEEMERQHERHNAMMNADADIAESQGQADQPAPRARDTQPDESQGQRAAEESVAQPTNDTPQSDGATWLEQLRETRDAGLASREQSQTQDLER